MSITDWVLVQSYAKLISNFAKLMSYVMYYVIFDFVVKSNTNIKSGLHTKSNNNNYGNDIDDDVDVVVVMMT